MRRSGTRRPLRCRCGGAGAPIAQTSRRHRARAGPGQFARAARAAERTRRICRSGGGHERRGHRIGQRSRGHDAPGGRTVRRIRQAQQEAGRRSGRTAGRHRRRRRTGRHDCGGDQCQGVRQAGATGREGPAQAPRNGHVLHGRRTVGASGRAPYSRPGEASNGKDPARILPQRAIEGDPERAWRRRGRQQRDCRTDREDRQDQAQ